MMAILLFSGLPMLTGLGNVTMQVRLKVQRVYAAVRLAIEAFDSECISSEKAHEVEVKKQADYFASLKTFCGGYKYDAETSMRMATEGSWMRHDYLGEETLHTYKKFARDRKKWNRLCTLSNMFSGKSNFMVWLDESDFKEICKFLQRLGCDRNVTPQAHRFYH